MPTPTSPSSGSNSAIARANRVLAAMHADYCKRYGDDASDLWVRPDRRSEEGDASGAVVLGEVTTRKQLRRLLEALREDGVEARVDVVVLEDLPADDMRLPLRIQFPAGRQALPMYRGQHDDRLVSEWLALDGASRVLCEDDPRTLIQLREGTLGWIDSDAAPEAFEVTGVPADDGAPFVMALGAGEQIVITHGALDELLGEAEEASDRACPYRLGGRNADTGIDCSALVQMLIWESTRRWLPRHSADQRRCGARVALDQVAPGDLLFVRGREKNWAHVGIVVDDERVVHACRLDQEVRAESLQSFLGRYQFSAARRVFRIGHVERGAA